MSTSKLLITIFICFVSSTIIMAQDTTYYDQKFQFRLPPKVALRMLVEEKKTSNDSIFFIRKRFDMPATLLLSENIDIYVPKNSKKKKSDSKSSDKYKRIHTSTLYYSNGAIYSTDTIIENQLEGYVKTYYSDGRLRRDDHYHQGNLLSGHCYNHDGTDTTWYIYYQPPMFPGGEEELHKFLTKNINYPRKASYYEISGTVVIEFVVETDGTIGSFSILTSPSEELSEETLRVLRLMPKWIPGIREGKPAGIKFWMPVKFTLTK